MLWLSRTRGKVPFLGRSRPAPGTNFGIFANNMRHIPQRTIDSRLMIMNLDSPAQNKPINTNTLIRNFEWLRLGMTETITSEDLTDILSGNA